MTKRTLYFHGRLKDLVPEPVVFHASTIAEAIRGVTSQIPGFKPAVGKPREVLRIEGCDTDLALFAKSETEEIHIYPAFVGAGGAAKIIIGVVMIAAAVILGPEVSLLIGTVGEGIIGATAASILMGMGVSLLLGGLLEVISPAPKMDLSSSSDNESSKYLGAAQNTVKIGTRIPLIVGRHMVYGHFVTFNVDAADVASTA